MAVYKSYAGEITNELDSYRTKGQKEAASHSPPSDSLGLDQHETTLLSKAEKWLSDEQRLFDSVLSETSRAIAETRQKTNELESRVTQLLSDDSLQGAIDADMAGERNKFVSASEIRMRAEVDWRHLRVTNSITSQALYPESLIWHFAMIGLFAFIELVINAFFYENEQGLIGGFAVALGVAVINIVGSTIAGYFWRLKNSISIDKKAIGWAVAAAFVFFTIYCNALFASFRSEYQLLLDPTDPLQVRQGFTLALTEARKIFFLDLHFADLTSLALFAVGVILSGFAFYKGYTLDDKYPLHGKLDRIVKAARQAEIELQDLLRQHLKDFLHHRRADIQSALNEPIQLNSLIARRIADLTSAQSLLRNQAHAIQRDFGIVLKAYRHANTAVRATPPPPYFKDVPDLTSQIDASATESALEQLQQVQKDIKEQRDTYQEQLSAKQQSLQIETSTILNHSFGVFVKEVESEAQDNINRHTAVIDRALPEIPRV